MTDRKSCVLLVPAEDLAQANDFAESRGYGPGNFSVPLVSGTGGSWYGCHAWCTQSFLESLEGPGWPSSMIVSTVDSGDPLGNWISALNENGLETISEEL